MSQENVEVVRSAVAAIAVGDRERAFAFFDPQIVVDATRYVFNPATYVGFEGLRQMAAATDETWEGIHMEAVEFIDAGDQVVVIGRLVGKGKGSGVEVAQPAGQVCTLRNGRIVRWEIGYTDRSEALDAVGLRE
jgi:ketosteroid isomerase-like protein